MPQPVWFEYLDDAVRTNFNREIDLLVTHVSETAQAPEAPFKKTSLGRQVDYGGREGHVRLVRALLAGIGACQRAQDKRSHEVFVDALATLLRRKIALTGSDVTALLSLLIPIKSTAAHIRLLGI